MLPLYVTAVFGLNATLIDVLPKGGRYIGRVGLVTINSGRLLDTCRNVMPCTLVFVTTTVTAAVVVPTATDPKFTVDALTPTAACARPGKSTEPIKNNPINRHTKRVLAI